VLRNQSRDILQKPDAEPETFVPALDSGYGYENSYKLYYCKIRQFFFAYVFKNITYF
jgi:hypothetical protein